MNTKRILIIALASLSLALPVAAQQPTVAEQAAMLKATLAASEVVLKQYQWIQTTVVSIKGDEKSRKQERCFYGADGTLTKVILNQSAPASEPRGFLRRKIAEEEKQKMEEYMKSAAALVRQYVPPAPARIQACKDSGNVSLQLSQPGKRARLTFSDYLKAGDSFAVDVDLTNNHPLAAKVNTYLESMDDPVTLTVTFKTLNEGTIYPSEAVLNGEKKKIKVTLDNSGYQKSTP